MKEGAYEQIIEGGSVPKHMDFRVRTFQAERIVSPKSHKMESILKYERRKSIKVTQWFKLEKQERWSSQEEMMSRPVGYTSLEFRVEVWSR